VRFVMKDGVRHVYISSLDELRKRLDLDETRVAGVSEEELRRKKERNQEPEKASLDKDDSSAKITAGDRDRDIEDLDDAESDLDVDMEKLEQNRYAPVFKPDQSRNRYLTREDMADSGNSTPGPILQKQEVREVFDADADAFHKIMFESANAAEEVDAAELNADIELMIRKVSARMSDESSREEFKLYAEKAREPLAEEAQATT